MSNGASSQKSSWNGPYGWNQEPAKSSDQSSVDESPTKRREQLLNASAGSVPPENREKTSDKDSDTDRAKDRSRRSRSPRHRRRRSSSRHRHERRRRSGSRSRRRRSRSGSRRRSRSGSGGKDQPSSSRRSGGERRLSTRSRSKDRSRNHRRRSRSRGRRSSSRSRRDRSRRSRSRDRSRRHRSRSRSRDRRRRRSGSRSKRRPASRSPSPYNYGSNQAMDAQERLARRLERAKQLTKLKKEEEQQRANGFIGLKDDKLKAAIETAAKAIAGSAPVTTVPHEAMSARATAQMNALRKQAEQETGISVPTYYNPLVVNPMMFAQQQAKRNLLWSKKDSATTESTSKSSSTAVWSKPSLGDEKSDEKFAKLMGIKQSEQLKSSAPDDEIKKRHELFSNLDQQYEQARVVTHTQRGAGLGFASSNPNTLLAQQANQQLSASAYPPKT